MGFALFGVCGTDGSVGIGWHDWHLNDLTVRYWHEKNWLISVGN